MFWLWCFWALGTDHSSPAIFFNGSLEAKDALKEATKEAAKKRKKEMQTATEDCKTARLEVLNQKWIQFDWAWFVTWFHWLALHHFARLKPQLLRREKRLDIAAKENHAYWKQRMKDINDKKYKQTPQRFAEDEIHMSYQPTWRQWNFAGCYDFVIHGSHWYPPEV